MGKMNMVLDVMAICGAVCLIGAGALLAPAVGLLVAGVLLLASAFGLAYFNVGGGK